MIESIEKVTDELLRNGLLNDDSLAESCHGLEKHGKLLTGPNLLSQLTAEGKLTPFQSEQVAAGRAGQLVLGNYVVLSRIGEGGMGTVFKAMHRRMQRVVALKVIRKEVATAEFITRFRREIHLQARLNHPNVVIAYDSDQCPIGDFLVMEYVDGSDLGEILKQSGPLSVVDAISAVKQAAFALGYAHQQGIVHRDVKPANMLRDVSGCVKVVDLGLARVVAWEGAKGAELTQMGAVAGSIDYMSPEQAENPMGVDQRSDIYSLGCSLFYLLTGGPVFTKPTLIHRILAHRSEPAPKLSVARADVSPELDAIFQRMVAKAPCDRFASMEDVVAALDDFTHPRATVALDQEASRPAAAKQAWSPEQATVVIVEESRLQASMIGKFLAGLGTTRVHVFPTGDDALQRLASISPTALLCSMKLPDMSGMELAARIRDSMRWLDVGIVLMSGDDFVPDQRSAALRLGRMELLKKPFHADGLRAAIEQAVIADRNRRPLEGLKDLKVLIVDDSGVARRHEQDVLMQLGFSQFTHADDGDTAIQHLQRSRFDLVVTDYHMQRVNGHDLVSHIRTASSQRDVPIIMVTTEFDPRKLGPIYQLGVSAISNKGFDRDLIRNVVMQLFA